MGATLVLTTPAIARERDVKSGRHLHGGLLPESSDLVGLVAIQERCSPLWQIPRWPNPFPPAPNPQTLTPPSLTPKTHGRSSRRRTRTTPTRTTTARRNRTFPCGACPKPQTLNHQTESNTPTSTSGVVGFGDSGASFCYATLRPRVSTLILVCFWAQGFVAEPAATAGPAARNVTHARLRRVHQDVRSREGHYQPTP